MNRFYHPQTVAMAICKKCGSMAVVYLSFFIIVSDLPSAFAKDPPTSAQELLNRFEMAVKAKDTNAVMSLRCWDGVADDIKKKIQKHDSEWICQREVKSLELAPLSIPTEFDSGGLHYFPNVSVVGIINVEFKETTKTNDHGPKAMKLPYGKKGDAFFFSGSIVEKLAPSASKQKNLIVDVDTLDHTRNVFIGSFTGFYVYVNHGREITTDIKGSNNLSSFFIGEYVKTCSVKNTSTKGSINLVIKIDDKEIFDSGTVKTDVIIYERKP